MATTNLQQFGNKSRTMETKAPATTPLNDASNHLVDVLPLPWSAVRPEWHAVTVNHRLNAPHYWYLDPSVAHAALRLRHALSGTL